MGMISQASTELFRRTDDESFETLEDLHAYNLEKMKTARQAKVNLAELEFIVSDESRELITSDFTGEAKPETMIHQKPAIVLPNGRGIAQLNNYSFNQLCNQLQIASGTLNKFPANLACDFFNYGVKNLAVRAVDTENPWQIDAVHGSRAYESNASLLYRENGSRIIDCIAGDTYGRFFDAQLSEFAMKLRDKHNLHRLPESPMIKNRFGFYSGQQDCFIAMIDNTRRVFEKDPSGGLSRMVMLANSEVNARPLWILGGFYSFICANHNFWNTETAFEHTLRHTRNIVKSFDENVMIADAKRFLEASPVAEENFINKARMLELGKTKEETIESLLKLRLPQLGKKASDMVYELAVKREDRYGSPRTVWGIANSITEKAQEAPYMNVRSGYEQAARAVFGLAA